MWWDWKKATLKKPWPELFATPGPEHCSEQKRRHEGSSHMIQRPGHERDLQIRKIKGLSCPSYEMYFSTALFDAWPLWEELCEAFNVVDYRVIANRDHHHLLLIGETAGDVWRRIEEEGVNFPDVVSRAWLTWKGVK